MQSEQYKKPKLLYINYLRAFAILLVVAGHTLLWGKYGTTIRLTNLYLFKGGTLLFVFIAGFLFQYLAYKFEYKKYLITKFKNVILPYWITMIPVAIIFAVRLHNPEHFLVNYPPIARFLNVMCVGQIINGPLWFVPMITVFFLFAPVLLKLKKYKILWISILICSFITTIILSRPSFEFGFVHYEGGGLLKWYFGYIVYIFKSFLYFLSAYIIGMYSCEIFEKHYDWIKSNIKQLTAIAFICFVYFGYLFVFVIKTSSYQMNISRFTLTFLMMFIFIMFEQQILKHKFLDKCLNILADYSFGIFFIHMYFINLMSTGRLFRSSYCYWFKPLLTTTSFKACMFCVSEFLAAVVGSILILYIVEIILTKLGIKNTRMFTGVAVSKK